MPPRGEAPQSQCRRRGMSPTRPTETRRAGQFVRFDGPPTELSRHWWPTPVARTIRGRLCKCSRSPDDLTDVRIDDLGGPVVSSGHRRLPRNGHAPGSSAGGAVFDHEVDGFVLVALATPAKRFGSRPSGQVRASGMPIANRPRRCTGQPATGPSCRIWRFHVKPRRDRRSPTPIHDHLAP